VLGYKILNYIETRIISTQGELIYASGSTNIDIYDFLQKFCSADLNQALYYTLNLDIRFNNIQEISSKRIFQYAIEKNFIAVDNNVLGFVTILPKTKIIERIIEKINSIHFCQLNAVEISFPTVFNNSSREIKNLTAGYTKENRMYSMLNSDSSLSLVYAADPGLLLYLKNKIINSSFLPYVIFSQTQVFRHYKKGEIAGFPQLREFPMPDLHIVCTKPQAEVLFLKNLLLASENMRKIFGEDWSFCIDITYNLYIKLENLISNVCKSINKLCVVNILKTKPRYYDLKSVFLLNAGDQVIMNYNMQWDEDNIKDFNISSDSKDELVILHGTLMHSWYKILPFFINKILTNQTQTFPFIISPIQVSIIILNPKLNPLSQKIMSVLIKNGIRTCIISNYKNVSKAINVSNKNHIPNFIILGNKEYESHEIMITESKTGKKELIDDFLKKKKESEEIVDINFSSNSMNGSIFV
jgi:threonyl-tRNA synthetase